jgi:hypothetical protein
VADGQGAGDGRAGLVDRLVLDVGLGQVEAGQGSALDVGRVPKGEYVSQGRLRGFGLAEEQVAGASEAGQPRLVEEVVGEPPTSWPGMFDRMVRKRERVQAGGSVTEAGVGSGL